MNAPDLASKVETEINKRIKDDFKGITVFPTWLVNIITLKKKNVKIRICIDF